MTPRGSLRRFPVVGSALAFLAGLFLAGVLNIPGFSEAQQQDSRYAVAETTRTVTPPVGAAAHPTRSQA